MNLSSTAGSQGHMTSSQTKMYLFKKEWPLKTQNTGWERNNNDSNLELNGLSELSSLPEPKQQEVYRSEAECSVAVACHNVAPGPGARWQLKENPSPNTRPGLGRAGQCQRLADRIESSSTRLFIGNVISKIQCSCQTMYDTVISQLFMKLKLSPTFRSGS